MRVRHFNRKNIWWERGDYVEPLSTEGNIIIVADPSKSNAAFIIGNTVGHIYDIIEFSGNDRKFYQSAGDTTVYCLELYEYIKRRTLGSKVIAIHAEQAITKKGKEKDGKKRFAVENHITNMALTEIRATLTRYSQEEFGQPLDEVNNWSWKRAVLPEGYRGQSEKGSKRYWPKVNPFWENYTDDVTDVYSIYVYLVNNKYRNERLICTEIEKPNSEFAMAIVDIKRATAAGAEEFNYSNNFTLEQNAIYYSNRKQKAGYAKISKDAISIEDIYRYGSGLNKDSSFCLVVVPKRR